MTISLHIGPNSPDHVGWALYLDPDAAPEAQGSWRSPGPVARTSPDAWFALAKRRVPLPEAVRAAKQSWRHASIQPLGWAEQPGHAPAGILLTWST